MPEVAERHRFEIQEMRAVHDEFPEVKKDLWGGKFWEDGYFGRTVGDKVTGDMISCYVKHHPDEIHDKQLKLF